MSQDIFLDACKTNDIKTVQEYIDQDDVAIYRNDPMHRDNPMRIVCMRGHLKMMKMLVCAGLFVDSTDLRLAVGGKHHDVVEVLLSLGVDVNEPSYIGETALWTAVWSKDYKMVDILLLAGANPHIKRKTRISNEFKSLYDMVKETPSQYKCFELMEQIPLPLHAICAYKLHLARIKESLGPPRSFPLLLHSVNITDL